MNTKTALLAALLTTGGCDTDTPSACEQEDLRDASLGLVDDFVDAFNAGDVDALDGIVTEAYIQHNPAVASGREGLAQFFAGYRASFPDATMTVESVHADSEFVVAMIAITGTHEAEFFGVPPSGEAITIRSSDRWRVEDGLLAEHWDVIDLCPLLCPAP